MLTRIMICRMDLRLDSARTAEVQRPKAHESSARIALKAPAWSMVVRIPAAAHLDAKKS
jgi:hypothetical protein